MRWWAASLLRLWGPQLLLRAPPEETISNVLTCGFCICQNMVTCLKNMQKWSMPSLIVSFSYRSVSVSSDCFIMDSQLIRAFQLCMWCIWLHMCMREVVLNDRTACKERPCLFCLYKCISLSRDLLCSLYWSTQYRPQHSAHKVMLHHYTQPLTFKPTFYC